MALTESFTELALSTTPVEQPVVMEAQMSSYNRIPFARALPIASLAVLLRMFAIRQLNAKIKIVLRALPQEPLPLGHVFLAMWVTILLRITPVGLLFHAGTSKSATHLLHLDCITLNLLQPALHSRHIAR